MGKKKKPAKITPDDLKDDLARWMKDPSFKRKYDQAMQRLIARRLETGALDLNDLVVSDESA